MVIEPSAAGDQVLLVWNADWREPRWSLPGGRREEHESLVEATRREVREETGLEIRVEGLIDVQEKLGVAGYLHLVIFTFRARRTGGDLNADGSADPDGGVSAARWFPVKEARGFEHLSRILDESMHLVPVGYSYEQVTPRTHRPSR